MLKEHDLIFSLFDDVNDGVYVVDPKRKILYFNRAAEKMSGYSKEEIVGKFCFDNILNHIDDKGTKLCLFGCPLQCSIDQNIKNHRELYLHHKNGHRVKVEVTTTPYSVNNEVLFGIEIFNDLTEINLLKKELMALKQKNIVDDLTQLFNRRFLSELYSNQQIIRSTKNNAVLFFDVDNFGRFNNLYGHELGDQLLYMISQTIANNIRSTDFALRYGGEEIIAILTNVQEEEAMGIAEKLRMLISSSAICYEDGNVGVTASIGVALFNGQEMLQKAIEYADLAMLEAKKQGKNRILLSESPT